MACSVNTHTYNKPTINNINYWKDKINSIYNDQVNGIVSWFSGLYLPSNIKKWIFLSLKRESVGSVQETQKIEFVFLMVISTYKVPGNLLYF